ncbi:MAG TPA: amino acid permease [Pyrinomonadaceae bacterium]|nr:amino acid permease [Pyrinomonadaceae bacterium]
MLRGIFRTKNLDDILKTAGGPQFSLKRTLGAFNVTLIGIGAIIGAGIFATVGTASAGVYNEAGEVVRYGAGPSLMLSFAITAIVCAFTALCYAELASMVPISGSAYTYSYATMGEMVAWIIGWDLIIEYAIGNVAVAISWAEFFNRLLRNIGIHLPEWMTTTYTTASPEVIAAAPNLAGIPIVFNLLAFGIVALITIVLVWGIRESAGFNAVMVGIKILVLLFFIVVALYYVAPGEMSRNWQPFQPHGWSGTLTGAAVVFFAYIGFDAVSTVAEETKNPARDLPIGIIASLVVCTLFYIAVAAVFTGIVPFADIVSWSASQKGEALTMALEHVAPQARWQNTVVAFGSVVAHTAVLLVFQLGQPRIFFSMARDGLLPPVFASVHPRFKTPHVTTILTGLIVGGIAAFATVEEMVNLTNIGTLFAFVLVCIGIPILRRKDPDRPRPFRVPFGPWLFPVLGALSCVLLMYYLPGGSWWRFIGWLMLGLSIYFAYGYTRSAIGREAGRPTKTPPVLKVVAVGFLLISFGLFVIPHDTGFGQLFDEATTSGAKDHTRALLGLVSSALGLLLALGGLALYSSRQTPESGAAR